MTSYIFIRYYIHYTYLPNFMYIYVCEINGLSSANLQGDKLLLFHPSIPTSSLWTSALSLIPNGYIDIYFCVNRLWSPSRKVNGENLFIINNSWCRNILSTWTRTSLKIRQWQAWWYVHRYASNNNKLNHLASHHHYLL